MSAPDFEALRERAAGLGLSLIAEGVRTEWHKVGSHRIDDDKREESVVFDSLAQVATYLRGVEAERAEGSDHA